MNSNREAGGACAEKTRDEASAHCERLRRLLCDQTRTLHTERRRFATALHNEPQQMLVSVLMRLNSMSREITDDYLLKTIEKMYRSTQQAIDKMRQMCTEMHPPILQHGSMTDVLVWLAAELKDARGLDVHFASGEEIRLENDELKRVLFDAVREILVFMAEQGGVKETWMRGSCSDGNLSIQVFDKGPGFASSAEAEHALFNDDGSSGLLLARELIEANGGEVEVTSSPDNGLFIEIKLPSVARI